MTEAKGTEAIEKLMTILASAAIVGKKVWADKEVNLKDLEHADDLLAVAKELYEFVQSKPELVGEFKDISVTEVLAVIAKGDALVKKVEQA